MNQYKLWSGGNLILIFSSILIVLGYEAVSAEESDLYGSPEDFEGFDNALGTPDGKYIVPNIVHFIRWHKEFTFIEAICLMAAVKNQKPDKVYIHGDRNFSGKYWDMAMKNPNVWEVVELKYLEMPTRVFGQELSPTWKQFHGADVERLKVLMKYGGIFLDNDSFLVRSLDEFRMYEMTLGWDGDHLQNQGIIAHKNARFLRKWLNNYRRYDPGGWMENSMERPTRKILRKEPHLIHRMKNLFCEDPWPNKFLYLERNNTWRNHYVIHLSVRFWAETGGIGANLSPKATYPVIFDENNIKKYNCTLRDMVQTVYSPKRSVPTHWHNMNPHRRKFPLNKASNILPTSTILNIQPTSGVHHQGSRMGPLLLFILIMQ